MIVPFVFSLNPEKKFELDWLYYKFTSFCYKYDYPIIAQGRYNFPIHKHFVNNNVFLNELPHTWSDVNSFCEDQDKDIDKYFIPEIISENMISKYGSDENAYLNYMIGENLELESFLENTILKIQEKHGKKITAFLNWNTSESLKKVANKYDIKVIHLELAPLRKYNYYQQGYLDFKGVHTINSLEEKYYDFINENIDVPILSNKELLALFLDNKYLDYINILDRQPEFKVGVVSSGKKNYFDIARNNIDSIKLFNRAIGEFDYQDILFRLHPSDPLKKQLEEDISTCNFDNSRSSLEFILKCESIATISSNMAFEAMVLGKKVYNLGNSPYKFCNYKDFNDKDEFEDIDKFLNFVIFGYMIPFSFINDAEYLMWRCSEPSIKEIYLKNFKYYMENLNISEKTMVCNCDKRLKIILESRDVNLRTSAEKYYKSIEECYKKDLELNKLSTNLYKMDCLKEQLTSNVEKLYEQIKDLSYQKLSLQDKNTNLLNYIEEINIQKEKIINDKEKLKIEKERLLISYNSIANSTIWKITKPLRWILDYIKKLIRR